MTPTLSNTLPVPETMTGYFKVSTRIKTMEKPMPVQFKDPESQLVRTIVLWHAYRAKSGTVVQIENDTSVLPTIDQLLIRLDDSSGRLVWIPACFVEKVADDPLAVPELRDGNRYYLSVFDDELEKRPCYCCGSVNYQVYGGSGEDGLGRLQEASWYQCDSCNYQWEEDGPTQGFRHIPLNELTQVNLGDDQVDYFIHSHSVHQGRVFISQDNDSWKIRLEQRKLYNKLMGRFDDVSSLDQQDSWEYQFKTPESALQNYQMMSGFWQRLMVGNTSTNS